jgi:hypothetical protein
MATSQSHSGDASVHDEGHTWRLKTAAAERVIALTDGTLGLKSLHDRAAGHDWVPAGLVGEQFRGPSAPDPLAGPPPTGWQLENSSTTKLAQGELQLDIVLRRGALRATRSYVVYPQSSIVREWVRFENAGQAPLRIIEPCFLALSVGIPKPDAADAGAKAGVARDGAPATGVAGCDLHWMTGGENEPGSWTLRTEQLAVGRARTFDSYEPFPSAGPPPTAGLSPGKYAFRMGSSSYAPWYALYNASPAIDRRHTGHGLFIGWDYFGHWTSSFRAHADGRVEVELRVAGHNQMLAPGEAITTPAAFVGLYADDLDNAGNELLDWQYRYLWDYTRDGWFPAIRALGYWITGTSWGTGVGWTGGNPDLVSTFRKVFRVADFMRQVGADVYHRDWGWWDRAGDWNGPDFRATGEYLRRHGMGQLIYAFVYTVHPESQVARAHPDWILGGSALDLSRPEVVAFLQGQLDTFVQRWGDLEWRNDGVPTCPRDGDDTPLLAQDVGLRQVIRAFLDQHPACAFQAVNGGGNCAGYDYLRYASSLQFSDGAVGRLGNYWATLLFPPDKLNDMPDHWDPKDYDPATWRGLLAGNFDMTGDTWDPAKLEGIRELVDIYHYLHAQGVVGRWVRVHRPVVDGDDPTLYLQRLSGDRRRGVIIPKRPAPGPTTIRPKGLLPGETYAVSFHGSEALERRSGADLMARGISVERMPPSELIYLNLPLHPGSPLDRQPPMPPRQLVKRAAEHMGFPGVELVWSEGSDDNWVSYYEIARDGVVIDKVAKGTFYFDHSAGADPAADYAVRTVDGAGNRSAPISTGAGPGLRAIVVDDAPAVGPDRRAGAPAEVKYIGLWRHERGVPPAHAGTISSSSQAGAVAELEFAGCRVRWFSKLGPDGGKAAVCIDDEGPIEIDTYAADHIWGVGLFSRDFGERGLHRISIRVLGQQQERSKGCCVHVDGFRVEAQDVERDKPASAR